MSLRPQARTSGALGLSILTALIIAPIRPSLADQPAAVRSLAAPAPDAMVRLTPAARARPDLTPGGRGRPVHRLTAAEKMARVRMVGLARPQPEAPILLNAKTTTIPNRATLYVKNGDLNSASDWGIFLPAENSTLDVTARLDASKTHLLDCLVLDDNGGGTVYLKAGASSTAITIGSAISHVTWVLVPQSTDWYTIHLNATSIASGPYGRTVALELSYCEITPFK